MKPLLLVFLTVFIDLVGFGLIIPVLPTYARELHASDTTVGATSVKVTAKLVLTLLPSALVAVIVTVCEPSANGAVSDHVQLPLAVPTPVGVIVPSDATNVVMLSS